MIPASVSAIPGVARTRPRAGLRRPRLATAPCSAPGAKAVPPSDQGDERFSWTVPVKQRSSKQSIYFQHVAAKKRTADHCQSNNRQAIARTFSSRCRPNPSASRLTHAGRRRPRPAPRGVRHPDAQGDKRFPRTVPVKQRSSKQSLYFQHVAAKKRTADRCQSNNRQAIARTFSSRHRPNPSASRLTQAVGDRALLRVESDIRTPKATNASRGQFQSSNGQANNRFISSVLGRKRSPRITANQTITATRNDVFSAKRPARAAKVAEF